MAMKKVTKKANPAVASKPDNVTVLCANAHFWQADELRMLRVYDCLSGARRNAYLAGDEVLGDEIASIMEKVGRRTMAWPKRPE